MARMWTCGFELQSTTAEVGVNSGTVTGGDNVPLISTTVHRQGTASARFNITGTAGTSYFEHQLTSGVVMRTFHRLYLRVDTLPSAETNVYAIGQASFFPVSLRLLPNGTLVLRDSNTGTTLTGTSTAVTLGRWHRFELDFTDVASGQSAFKGYMDGTLFADALCTNINGFSRIRIGPQVAATCDLYIDDVAVNDTTGTVQNGLPGPGSVVHLRPDSAGDANGWETAVGGTAGAANNWTRVSERTPDDATSYNQTTATGTTTTDDFNVESSTTAGIGSGDTITLVQVGGRVASDNTTAASIVYRLKGQSGGTVVESPSVTVANTSWSVHRGQSPRPYQLTAYTNPQSGAAWTPSALDTLQIGYRSDVSQTTVRRVSTLWALVEFLPGTVALGTAAETDTAQALGRRKARALGTAVETDNGQAAARAKSAGLALSAESSAAQALARVKQRSFTAAAASEAGQLLGRMKRLTPGQTAETAVGMPLVGAKARPLPPAAETSDARALSGQSAGTLPAATEATTSQPITGRKVASLAGASAVEAAQPLAGRKARGLVPAAATTTARPLGRSTRQDLTAAGETAHAQRLAIPGTAQPAVETSATRPLTGSKSQQLTTASVADEAQPLSTHARLTLGHAVDSAASVPLGRTKTRALAAAAAVDTAQQVAATKALAVGVAVETSRALIGPKVRLTWATDQAQALPLGGRRQQPADRLDATTSSPALGPSSDGARLTTSSSGPHLAASVTGGG